MSRLLKRSFLACLLLLGMQVNAHADGCIEKAASCIVNSAKAGYYGVSAVSEVLEFSVKHPQCVAAIIAQDYISLTTMTTVSGLAAANVIGSSESGCKQDLYGKYAPKIAVTLASVVPNQTLQDVASGAVTTGIESLLSAVPFPGSLPSVGLQLECGCAIADAGADMIEKIKKTAQYTGAAAKACAGTMSCLGGAALDALKGTAEVFYQVGECIGGPNDCGENAPMAESSYYTEFWGKYLNMYVEAQMTNGKLNLPDGPGYLKLLTPEQFISSTWHECEDYYLNHRYSGGSLSTGDHAQRACNTMRDRFYAEASATRGLQMDNEVFPKVAAGLTTPYLKDCDITKPAAINADGSVTIDSNSEAAKSFGSDQLKLKSECIQEILYVIGKAPDGSVIAQDGSALGEVKNTYKANNFDIKDTYNKLMISGSKYDQKLKEISTLKKTQINVSGQLNNDNVFINLAYEKSANAKWAEYKAKCPAKDKKLNSLNSVARPICLSKTASYLGVEVNQINDTNPNDDFGSVNFLKWSTTPPIYAASLKDFPGKGQVASQDLANTRVGLAFVLNKSALDALLPASIEQAKVELSKIRQEQEQKLDAKLTLYTDSYSASLECKLPLAEAINYTCKYAQFALDAMFKEWLTNYQKFLADKSALDKELGDKRLAFPGDKSDNKLYVLIDKIDAAIKSSSMVYRGIKEKPNAIIKESKLLTIEPEKNKLGVGLNKLDDATKDKKAQRSATDVFGNPVNGKDLGTKRLTDLSNIYKNDVKDFGTSALPQKPERKVLGMRGAPGMIPLDSAKPVDLTKKVPDSSPAKGAANGLPDNAVTLDKQAAGLDAQSLAQQNSRGMRTAPGMQKIGGAAGPAGDFSKQGVLDQMPPGGGLAAGLVPEGSGKPSVASVPSPADQAKGIALNNALPNAASGAGDASKFGSLVAPPAARGMSRGGPAAVDQPKQDAYVQALDSNKPLQAAAVPQSAPAPEPPFDRQRYQHMTRQKLEAKWYPQCNGDSCKAGISSLIDDRIREILSLLDAGQDLRVKATYDAAEAKMDYKYDPKMQDKVSQSRVIKNEPPAAPTTPVAPPKTMKIKNFGLP